MRHCANKSPTLVTQVRCIHSAHPLTPSLTVLPSYHPVFLAMSGGVDSSVVALLMSRLSARMASEGHAPLSLVPVYMRNWSTLEESNGFEPGSGGGAGCEWQQEFRSVEEVCKTLGLAPPRLIDLTNEYWRDVFEPSLGIWGEGRTPNPDVICNRLIKFGALLDKLIPPHNRRAATRKSWLATGHYGKLLRPSHDSSSSSSSTWLYRAKDRTKDQSYFLSSVPSSKLTHALFPLADLHKTQVRQLAKEAALPTAAKKESMGLCFVGVRGRRQKKAATITDESSVDDDPAIKASFGGWLSSFLPDSSSYTRPGTFVALDGQTIGNHSGLHTLTIGQGAKLPGQSKRLFVARKEVRNGIGVAVVVPGSDHPLLQCTAIRMRANEFHWIDESAAQELAISQSDAAPAHTLQAQIRHRSDAVPCTVAIEGLHGEDRVLSIRFLEAHPLPTAVTSGQVLALYSGDRCLGSGVIPSKELGLGITSRGEFLAA